MKKYVSMCLMICLLAFHLPEQVRADEDAVIPSLTLDEAVQWARTHSYQKRMAQQSIQRSEISREHAAERVFYTPIGTGNGEEDAADRSALKNLVSADISLQMSKKELEVVDEQIRYQVMLTYQDIFVKENDVKNKEEALELAKLEEQAMLALDKVGRISQIEKNNRIKVRLDAEQQLVAAKEEYAEAYVKLNTLLGKPSENIYQLVDRPNYAEPEVLNLETHMSRKVSSSPTIWLLEKQVEQAELDVTLFTFNAGQSYEMANLDVTRAKTSLANSKEQLRETIRNIYSNLNQQEEQYQTLQRNLQSAEEAWQVAQVRFDSGLVTALEVKKEEINVNQIKRNMEETAIRIDQLKFRLDRPWV